MTQEQIQREYQVFQSNYNRFQNLNKSQQILDDRAEAGVLGFPQRKAPRSSFTYKVVSND